MKYDRRSIYGTVIPCQFRKDDGAVFVVWDRSPNIFTAYRCGEVRLVRTNEEERIPEGTLMTEEDFINAAKKSLAKISIDENGKLFYPTEQKGE